MPLVFNTIDELITYVDNNIKENHNEEIIGKIHNNVENGIIQYIKAAALNFFKAGIVSIGGDVALSSNVTVIITTTPDSLTWGDNFLNEWYVINMTALDIPLAGSLVYYNAVGQALSTIPANSIVHVFKATNDLWVLGSNSTGGGGGSVQKQPKTYIVGTTPDAPVDGTTTWTLPIFLNSYVVLFAGTLIIDMTDAGDGTPYIDKPLASDILTISNYTFTTGDKLSYILITP